MSTRLALLHWRRLLGAVCLSVALSLAARGAGAREIEVAWIPGDQESAAAVRVAKELSGDPAYSQVRFHLLPYALFSERDAETVARSQVLVVRTIGRDLDEKLAPAIGRLKARGRKAYAVGNSFEESQAKAGMTNDADLRRYAQFGGAENQANLMRLVLYREFGLGAPPPAARELPQTGLWNARSGRIYEEFRQYETDYLADRPQDRDRPWVGILINRGQAVSGASETVLSIAQALEARGFNVLPSFSYPAEVAVERFYLDEEGRSRVVAMVAIALKFGSLPDKAGPVFQRVDAPIINAISLYQSNREQWEASPIGLDVAERSWQISGPEFSSAIAPTVVASKERLRDAQSGLEYVVDAPIGERIERLADRVQRLAALRFTPASQKRVAIMYYNYPPGKENVGASYLNVLPRTLWQLLQRLESDGYDVTGMASGPEDLFRRVMAHGTNVGNWAPGALAQMVSTHNVVTFPVARYRRWLDALPERFRSQMLKSWGEPEKSDIMVWRDAGGEPYFVFPVLRFGNVLMAPQPDKGWGQDIEKMYHDLSIPPHHQYLAFYLWLQREFGAHAMVHVGTHATHEWMPGKEVGFTDSDPSEILVGAVPQIYPYTVDDVGEALQAKRRGMADIVSHMTAPFNRAVLNPDLVELKGSLSDYDVAVQKSDLATRAKLDELNDKAFELGVLKDLGLDRIGSEDDVEKLEAYLEEIAAKQTPYGLHTFGVAPEADARRSTAEAMAAAQGPLPDAERQQRIDEYDRLFVASAQAELEAFSAALAGRYVAAGPGGDPLRNPASLPTGKNVFGFDPSRMPSPGTFAQGAALAEKLVAEFKARHGAYPERLQFVLWLVESSRHGGVVEAEILSLIGVRPKWDRFGRVVDIEVVPRSELGRPRVDVTVTPSGLYRDSLPTLMLLIDKAITQAKGLEEPDNAIRAHTERARRLLTERGVPDDEAARMAAVRVFTEAPGSYGTMLDNLVQNANTWQNESQLADVYFHRVGHLFGQGFWGGDPKAGGDALAQDVFKEALRGVQATIHSRSSNVYATLDNDDVFQYLGGAVLAARQVNGRSPEAMILNLSNPADGRHESLEKYMGREMRTRLLNPEWIKAMMNEGYAGARHVMKGVEHLWGFQVTVPEAVDATKWQQIFEVYVQDKYRLDIQRRFQEANNLLAYQALVDKMLVAVRKGYWKAAPDTIARLQAKDLELIAQAGVACNANTCSSPEIAALAKEQDRKEMERAQRRFGLDRAVTPAAPPSPATARQAPAPSSSPTVRGQELKETSSPRNALQQLMWTYLLLIIGVVLGGSATQAWQQRREAAARAEPARAA